MTTMTQGEAVFQAARAVFETGTVPPTTTWTKQQKDLVHDSVFMMFKAGMVNKTSGGQDDSALRKYIPGLVNNWVRKDKRLNGGITYVPKNPGSRTGSGDDVLRNLKALAELQKNNPEAVAEIQKAIDARMEELKPKTEINIDLLPASLRKFVVKAEAEIEELEAESSES